MTPSNQRCRRLLVVTHLFLPDSCGGAPIFSDLCHGLAGRGIDVTVRCAYPYYPEWKDKSGRNGFRIEKSEENGLKIERYGLYIPRNPRSIWQRFLYESSFFLSISRSLPGDSRFDAVLVFCPLAGSIAYAGLHKLLYRRPLCLNIQDLPADAAVAGGIVAGRPVKAAVHFIQKTLFNSADVWRTISPVMIKRLESLRAHGQPLHFIPDWLHPTIAHEISRLPSKTGRPLGKPVRLLYSGNIGGKQGLLEFCKVLQRSNGSFEFRIHGDGGSAAQVSEWVASCGDARFSFSPLLSESGFVRALHDADFYAITEKEASGASFFPSKTIPAMASGTPVLAVSSPDSPLGREMLTERIGPWFSWNQCHQAASLFSALETSPQDFHTWRQNALRRSLFFDRDRCLNSFQHVLEELAREHSLAVSVSPAEGLSTPVNLPRIPPTASVAGPHGQVS